MKIPFNKPALVGKELYFIQDAIRRGQLSGDGHYTQACSKFLKSLTAAADVLMTPSCTHALELAYLLAGIRPGEEVLLPSFTFPSTANAFVLRGGVPKFVDIRSDTCNMDENKIIESITAKTKVLAPVHYGGVPCEMDVIKRIARKHRFVIMEDAAQALGARYRGYPAGTLGDYGAMSFHETKNCISGEGGGLFLKYTKDQFKARAIRQKGTNRDQFLNGKTSQYEWVMQGSSYVMSELQSAFLFAQLQKLKSTLGFRKKLWMRYYNCLKPLEKAGWIKMPFIPDHVKSSHHIFHVIFNNKKERDHALGKLNRRGIHAIFHYVPLHLSPMGKKFGYRKGDLPVTEKISNTLLRLPLYNSMSFKTQDKVISALTQFFKGKY